MRIQVSGFFTLSEMGENPQPDHPLTYCSKELCSRQDAGMALAFESNVSSMCLLIISKPDTSEVKK